MKLTATLVRTLVVLWLVNWVFGLTTIVWYRSLIDAWEQSDYDVAAGVYDRLATIASISNIGGWIGQLLILVAAVALAASLVSRAGRRLAWLGVGGVVLSAGWRAIHQFAIDPIQPPDWLSPWLSTSLWVAALVARMVGVALPVLALIRIGKAGPRARNLLVVFFGTVAVSALVLTVRIAGDGPEETTFWIQHALFGIGCLAFLMAGFSTASSLATADPDSSQAGAVVATSAGSALRWLGAGLLARVGLSVGAVVLMFILMRSDQYATAGRVTVVMTFLGAAVTVLLLFALVGYGRLPTEARSGDALVWAFGALVIGLILDIAVASSASALFEAAEQIRSASSLWSMPSLSDLKRHEGVLRWGGHAVMIIGLLGALSIVYSLSVTARWLDDEALIVRGKRSLKYLAIVGTTFIGLRLFIETRAAREVAELILAAGVLLLILGVSVLVDWLILTFRVAEGIDRRSRVTEAFE